MRLGQRARGFGRVVQRLREQRQIDRSVRQRHLLEIAALPRDVRQFPPRRQRPCLVPARRAIDRRPSRDAPSARTRASDSPSPQPRSATSSSRQQQAERPRPRGPAASRHELPPLVAVPARVREAFLPDPSHLRQPAHRPPSSPTWRGRTLSVSHAHSFASAPLVPGAGSARQVVPRERPGPFLRHEARLAQQAEMPRHPRLRDAQDGRQLGHVQRPRGTGPAAGAGGSRRRAGGGGLGASVTSTNLHSWMRDGKDAGPGHGNRVICDL